MSDQNTPAKLPDFESSLKKLETIVTQMEKSDLSLEKALKQFEEGVKLARHCQQALSTAEQQVEVLSADQQNEENA